MSVFVLCFGLPDSSSSCSLVQHFSSDSLISDHLLQLAFLIFQLIFCDSLWFSFSKVSRDSFFQMNDLIDDMKFSNHVLPAESMSSTVIVGG